MIVQATYLHNFNDLIQDLKSQFPHYSVYEFDSMPLKSIIVRKSAIVGAQLTCRDNEITVDACYPNMFVSSVMSLLTASTIFPFNSWPKFEIEISDFLKKRYNPQVH